ncbi:tape measure protein [Novosphingobium profundi]|uniref:tape measure protein n=1 Tax=Novosphingobium profundi TaxID=1774954 RepID=UPI001BDAED8D|nr:tape measure protein [Novosphingobium profundi]MBT0668399.1 tape measure protein [Novosphingobium profundi]
MSETVVRIVVDSSNARSESLAAERSLDRFGNASQRLDRNLGSLDLRITSVTRNMRGMRTAIGTLGVGFLIREFTQLADVSTQMDAKLRLAAGSQYSFAQAQRDTHDISKRTRSELSSTTTLYAKMTQNGKALKATQEEIARATETVTKSLKVSGATNGETSSTVLQLGQALASGKLAGDEFRSLAENAPRLMQLIADAIGKPKGELKKLASEGKLTSEVLFKALSDKRFTAALDEEFNAIPPTFGDAMTAVKNAAIDAFGAFDKGGQFSQSIYNFATGATGDMGSITKTMQNAGQTISTALRLVIDNASTLGLILGGVVAAKIGLFAQTLAVNAVGALVAFRNANLGAVAGALALARVAPVAGTATIALTGLRAAGSGLLAIFGGPIGAAVTALTVAFGYFAATAANTASVMQNTNNVIADTDTLIKQMSLSGDDAKTTVTGVGTEANSAVPKINAFAGAVGEAAQKLYELAEARRAANVAELEGRRTELSQQYTELYKVSKKGRREAMTSNRPQKLMDNLRSIGNWAGGELGELVGAGTPDAEIEQRMKDLKTSMGNIDKSLKQITATPLKTIAQDPNLRAQAGVGGVSTIPLAEGSGSKGTHKKTDAEREAERAAKEAERQKQAAEDLWRTLEENRQIASKMPIEAEKFTAQLDLQNAGGKELTAQEKERLSTLLDQTRAAKLLTDLKVANDNGKAELDYQKRRLSMTDKEAAIAESAWEWEKRALEEKVDLSGEEYKAQLDQVKARAAETYEIEKQNRLIKSRESLLRDYSPANAQELDLEQIAADRKQLDLLRSKSLADGGITEEQYRRSLDGLNRATAEVATRFEYELGQSIDQLGSQFSGTLGKVISKFGQLISGLADAARGSFGGLGAIGSLIEVLGKNTDGTLNGIGQAASRASQNTLDSILGRNGQKSALLNPLKSLGDGFEGFTGDMKKIFTGKGPGSVAGAIGNTLGNAASGMQMGQMADGLMKALGIGSSSTGAQLGGALGSAVFGPIGGLIGSIGGGLLGGLFKKKKYGTASISLGDQGYLTSDVTGNKAAYKQAATGAATNVISGLDQIADALGGSLTGSPTVSIGQYKGKWRVSDTGRTGKLKGNYSDVTDFGKDGQEAAIEYAMKVALQQGVLSGISDFSKRVLSAAEDLDRAVDLASKYENIVKELARIDDPIGAPLAELNKEWKTLREEMVANAATASELANVDRYYMLQRQQMLEDQLSDLNSLKDKLMGEGSGLSAVTQLNNKLSEFAKYEADIAAGKAVDTSALSALGSDIWDLTKDTYGTSTAQAQNIRDRLLSAVDGASSAINDIYAADTTGNAEAIEAQTSMIAEQVKQTNQTNQTLADILEAIRASGSVSAWKVSSAVNGYQSGTV